MALTPEKRAVLQQYFSQQKPPADNSGSFMDSVSNIAGDIGRGFQKRAIGTMQLAGELNKYNPVKLGLDAILPDSVTQKVQATEADADRYFSDKAAQLQRESTGRGWSGVVGELVGDPLTYFPIGKIGSIPQAIGKGAAFGTAAGATDALTEDQSRLESTGKGTLIGGVAGGAIKGGVDLLSTGAGKVKDAITHIMPGQKESLAYRSTAKALANQGIDPQELIRRAGEAKTAGTGVTLPEYTGNRNLLNKQKYIAKSGRGGSEMLSDYVETRANETVPNRLMDYLDPIAEKKTSANKAYTEFFNATDNLQPVDLTPVESLINSKIMSSTKGGTKRPFYERTSELVKETKARGATPRAIQELKDELGLLINQTSGGNIAVKNKLNSDAVDITKTLVKQTDSAYPEYARLRADFGEGATAADVLNDLSKTQVGSTTRFYNKVYGTPELQRELSKSMEPNDFAGLQEILKSLKQIQKGGLTGSDTAFNQVTGEQLAKESGSRIAATIRAAGNPIDTLANFLDEKLLSRNYEELANVFVNPDIKRLAQELRRVRGNPAQQQNILNQIGSVLQQSEVKAAPLMIENSNKGQSQQLMLPAPEAAIKASSLTPEKREVLKRYFQQPQKQVTPPEKESRIDSGIIKAEGVRNKAYKDTLGKVTIGIGFNMDSPNARAVWQQAGIQTAFDEAYKGRVKLSDDEIGRLAEASYGIAETDARGLVPNFDKLSKNRQDALVQLSYQLGKNRMSQFKNTLALVEKGNWKAAANQILNSKLAKQTPNRAKAVAKMLAYDVAYNQQEVITCQRKKAAKAKVVADAKFVFLTYQLAPCNSGAFFQRFLNGHIYQNI